MRLRASQPTKRPSFKETALKSQKSSKQILMDTLMGERGLRLGFG